MGWLDDTLSSMGGDTEAGGYGGGFLSSVIKKLRDENTDINPSFGPVSNPSSNFGPQLSVTPNQQNTPYLAGGMNTEPTGQIPRPNTDQQPLPPELQPRPQLTPPQNPTFAPPPAPTPPWQGIDPSQPGPIASQDNPQLPQPNAPASAQTPDPNQAPTIQGGMRQGAGAQSGQAGISAQQNNPMGAFAEGLLGGPTIGNSIASGLRGLMTGRRADANAVTEAHSQAVYNALAPKIGHDAAMAAALDPRMMPKYERTGTDFQGYPTYGWVSPLGMQVSGPGGPQQGGQQQGGGIQQGPGGAYQMPDGSSVSPSSTQTGQAYLDSIRSARPDGYENEIKNFASGKNTFPPTMLRSNAGRAIFQDIINFDHEYSTDVAISRQKNRNSFEGDGQVAQKMRALALAREHMSTYGDAVKEMNNFKFVPGNYVYNKARQLLGSSAPTNPAAVMQGLAMEIGKSFVNAGVVPEGEVQAFMAPLNTNSSPQQTFGALSKMDKMLEGQQHQIKIQWDDSMKGAKDISPPDWNVRFNQAKSDQLQAYAEKIGAVPSTDKSGGTVPAFKPKPGGAYRYDPATGSFAGR